MNTSINTIGMHEQLQCRKIYIIAVCIQGHMYVCYLLYMSMFIIHGCREQ